MTIRDYRTFGYQSDGNFYWKGVHNGCSSVFNQIAIGGRQNRSADRPSGTSRVVLPQIPTRFYPVTAICHPGRQGIPADRLPGRGLLPERLVRFAQSPENPQDSPLHDTAKSPATPVKKNAFLRLQSRIFQWATKQGLLKGPVNASIDTTGLESHHISQHYLKRKGRTAQYRRWHKLILLCDNDSHLIPGAEVGYGPSYDGMFLPDTVKSAVDIIPIRLLLGDSGFDDEKNHILCREQLQIKSVIALNRRGSRRGVVTGKYRKQLDRRFPEELYHQRAQAENVISCLKRRLESYLRARTENARQVECLMRVLTFNLMILLCTFLKSIRLHQTIT
jgi:hypothetical protein